jgi:hypothetical protein
MPYTPAQHRLFQAAAHNPKVAQRVGIPQDQAKKMASEGVKKEVIKALRK